MNNWFGIKSLYYVRELGKTLKMYIYVLNISSWSGKLYWSSKGISDIA